MSFQHILGETMSEISTVRTHPERSVRDMQMANRIMDEAVVCHVAFSMDGQPFNLPMTFVRVGESIYLHASVKGRIYSVLKSGVRACITFTILDGIVLAKSVYNTSMNYRSVMAFGTMNSVEDKETKLLVSEKLTEKICEGRWSDCRHPTDNEFKATGFLEMKIQDISVKIRDGPPVDNKDDLKLPHWSGIIPVNQVKGTPEPVPDKNSTGVLPDYLETVRMNRKNTKNME